MGNNRSNRKSHGHKQAWFYLVLVLWDILKGGNTSMNDPLLGSHRQFTLFFMKNGRVYSTLNWLFKNFFIYVFPTVQHGDPVRLTCIHSFFSHYVFHHKWLDRVPSDTQQDPIANPSWRQHSASIYPKIPVPPTPSPSPLATTRLFSKSMIFFSVERFLCARY